MNRQTAIRLTQIGISSIGVVALSASGAIAQPGGGSAPILPTLQNAAISEPSEPTIYPSNLPQSASLSPTTQDILTPLEQSVIDEMNLVRQNPGFYAELLLERRQYYNDTILEVPGQLRLQTQEGVTAVDEAIAALQAADSLMPLTFSPGLSQAAADHAADLAPGRIGHVGSDGSVPSTRASQYGTWSERMGENISYGSETARDFVLELIIDDGIPSRGHREAILNPDYVWTGVGCDRHAVYRTVCVMTYAIRYQDLDAPATTSSDSADAADSSVSTPAVQQGDTPNFALRYRRGR